MEDPLLLEKVWPGVSSHDEWQSVTTAIQTCLVKHGAFQGLSPDEVMTKHRHAVFGGLNERVMGLSLPPSYYTMELASALQREVLSAWPAWSIEFEWSDESTRVVLTSQSIHDGSGAAVVDPDGWLARFRNVVATTLDKTEGPRLQQYQWVKQRVPKMMSNITPDRPYYVIGMFDNWRGKEEWISVWMLTSETDSVNLHAPGVEIQTGSGTKPVSSDGVLHERMSYVSYGKREIVEAVNWSGAWLIPATYEGDVLIVTDKSDGRTWEIPYDRSQIMTDDQLRKELREAGRAHGPSPE